MRKPPYMFAILLKGTLGVLHTDSSRLVLVETVLTTRMTGLVVRVRTLLFARTDGLKSGLADLHLFFFVDSLNFGH